MNDLVRDQMGALLLTRCHSAEEKSDLRIIPSCKLFACSTGTSVICHCLCRISLQTSVELGLDSFF